MFAIFSRETALPPAGLVDSSRSLDAHLGGDHAGVADLERPRRSRELKRQCSATLDRVHSTHLESQAVNLGEGNGFNFRVGPFCHYAAEGSVSCLFSGQIAEWPALGLIAENHNAYLSDAPEDARDEASWLLTFYQALHHNFADKALDTLAEMSGSFAFIIYDGKSGQVLAARDPNGAAPLFWGSTLDGRMMFAADQTDLTECDPTATAFPAGSLFVSKTRAKAFQPGSQGWTIDKHVVPGELRSFVPCGATADSSPYCQVQALPRIDSKGRLCGAVYRVARDSRVSGWGETH